MSSKKHIYKKTYLVPVTCLGRKIKMETEITKKILNNNKLDLPLLPSAKFLDSKSWGAVAYRASA
jgi:hypothetical protein